MIRVCVRGRAATSRSTVAKGVSAVAGLLGLLLVGGCTVAEPVMLPAPPPAPPPPVESAPVIVDEDDRDLPHVEIFSGADGVLMPQARPKGGGGAGDVTLDFADADIKDAVRTVFGDILKAPYTIDPQVQGKITLKTSQPLRRNDVIAVLETALKANNAVIVLANNVYNVVPASEAQRRIDGFEMTGSARARLPGYGVEVVPLRYVAATEMQKLLQPVSPQGGVMAVDPARNILFLAGTGPERSTMLDTIRLFDVDYMRGMSYALIHPKHADAPALADDLSRISQAARGSTAGVLRFVSLPRLNTVLVVAPRAALLKDVQRWVTRLDVPPRGPGRRIYFYRLQNAKAQDVARSLAAVYGSAVSLAPIGETFDEDLPSDLPPAFAPSQNLNANDAPLEPTTLPAAAPPARAALRGSNEKALLHVAVDEPNNALIIRADGSEYAALERFLKEIDIAPDQVLIEVTIVEVTLNDALKFGVEWFFKNADQTFTLSKTGNVSSAFPGFSFTYIVPDVEIAVNALGTISDVNVISSPKLLTLNNRAATLQVGDQVPVIIQSATGIRDADDPTIVNAVQFRDTGIVLRVTPRIAKSGMVFVDINQEVSDAVPTTTSGIDSPTIQQRKLSTTVAVQDGATIALGGLIRRSETHGDSGVPVLKDVPLLGKLFSSTDESGLRTELLIFLKPKIIRNAVDAREMTEDLRHSLARLRTFMVPESATP
jgi:general secretion pathway protein D